jgi:hypothetical protein
MERNTKEEQTAEKQGSPTFMGAGPVDKSDHRLPHEIAAAILTAAHEVVVKKLEWERETGR